MAGGKKVPCVLMEFFLVCDVSEVLLRRSFGTPHCFSNLF